MDEEVHIKCCRVIFAIFVVGLINDVKSTKHPTHNHKSISLCFLQVARCRGEIEPCIRSGAKLVD